MSFMKWMMILYAIVGIAFGLYVFVIGSLGLSRKRPVVFSARQLLWFMLASYVPIALMILDMFFEEWGNLEWSLMSLYVFQALMLALVVFVLWRQMSGYMIFGVSDETFREALTSALAKLNLPYQENISRLKLTSLNADLQAVVASWMGSAQIRIKQPQQAHYTRVIADAMNEYYANHTVKVNNLAFIVYILMGILLIAFILGFWIRGPILNIS